MLRGQSVSAGVAVGRAAVLRTAHGWVARVPIPADAIEAECRRLRAAAQAASQRLASLAGGRSAAIGGEVSAILSAHSLIALDPDFLKPIERRIRREQVNAEWSLRLRAEELKQEFARLSDPVFSARGDDVLEVARAIASELAGSPEQSLRALATEEGSILVADELSPAQAVRLNPSQYTGIALERGGIHSHAAIIARSFGLPAVVGVSGLLDLVAKNRPILVDGDRGTVEPNPTKEQIRRGLERAHSRVAERLRKTAPRAATTRTADGVRVALRANLELEAEAEALDASGAEGIGLFRSEFLALDVPGGAPGVEEQRRVYEALVRRARPHPVVVRTYDLGGEKDFGAPATGPLGLRGIRYSLTNPAMFRDQLRALLRASKKGDLRILLPMVSDIREVREARRHLRELALDEKIERLPPVGAMVEIPSAALTAGALAGECDFFSIGTNDLAQYTLAADRTDPVVAPYYRPASPAVLRMIKWVVDAGGDSNRAVSVCGELAGDPLGAALLVGLGVRDLSMSPVLIPQVQDVLGSLDSRRLADVAARALECRTAEEVTEILARLKKKAEL
ncbi:MAG: phosphoenolpyruvate--protein phosphotransferase [Thermoanaerobaculia bacterium]